MTHELDRERWGIDSCAECGRDRVVGWIAGAMYCRLHAAEWRAGGVPWDLPPPAAAREPVERLALLVARRRADDV